MSIFRLRDATAPLQIQASGQQWLWRYEYPDGETFSYYELVVPVDTAVIVNLASTDVVHRWFVPGRRQVRRRPRSVEPNLVQGR